MQKYFEWLDRNYFWVAAATLIFVVFVIDFKNPDIMDKIQMGLGVLIFFTVMANLYLRFRIRQENKRRIEYLMERSNIKK